MEKELPPMDIFHGEELVQEMKTNIATEMIDIKEKLLKLHIPERDEYETEEEYQKAVSFVMFFALSNVKELKKTIFQCKLEEYNEFLTEKREWDSFFNEKLPLLKAHIKRTSGNNKRIAIVTAILTVLLSSIAPIVIAFLYMLLNNRLLIKNAKTYKDGKELEEYIDQVQRNYYDVIFDLRDDFHRSNEELDKLMERALCGEMVLDELLEIVNPKRLSLPEVKPTKPALIEEKPKQYVLEKKDN